MVSHGLRAGVVEVRLSLRTLAVKSRKAGHNCLLAGVQGVGGGGGLKVKPDDDSVVTGRAESLNRRIAQPRVVQFMADGINAGWLAKT